MSSESPHTPTSITKEAPQKIMALDWNDRISTLLDSKFLIPGTQIRFGVEFILGLVSGIGDIISSAISGSLIVAMVSKGVSTVAIFKMLWNIFLDTLTWEYPYTSQYF